MKPPSIHRRPHRPEHLITRSPGHRIIAVIALMISSFAIPHSSFGAESPTVIPFQGQVTDQQNQIVTDGQYSLIFNLYDVAVGGQPLWTERHSKVGVVNGMVNLFLGSITAMSGVDFSQTRYLGITVDVDDKPTTADPEMVPRQMIIPAFHAKTAENATKLAGHDWTAILVSGNNPATGKILADKIEPEAVAAGQLATDSVESAEIASGAVGSDEIEDGAIVRADLSTDVLNATVPAGSIMPFAGPGANIPAGWLLCDGNAVDSTVYPSLFAAIGTAWGDGSDDGLTETDFRLPDLRGQFLRGVANGKATDPDRTSRVAQNAGGNSGDLVGSQQDDEFKAHTHAGPVRQIGGITYQPGPNTGADGLEPKTPTGSTGGSETRPKNVYVNYIIKY